MEIIEEDFTLTSVNDGGRQWDLYLLKTIKPKSGPAREELQLYGYGMSLQNALKVVAHYRTVKNKETMSLREYIKDYKSSVEKLCQTYLN